MAIYVAVLLEAVYRCFTRTTIFTCLYDQSLRLLSPSFVTLYFEIQCS